MASNPAGFLDVSQAWVGSFFPVAFTRAAGLGPLPSGVHDEVLSRDQGEGRNEEDHWTIWSYWEAAG